MDKVILNLSFESFIKPEPEDQLELKPILRGELGDEIHSLLYWVDKDNPRGPIPLNPSDDPQFKNWEYSVGIPSPRLTTSPSCNSLATLIAITSLGSRSLAMRVLLPSDSLKIPTAILSVSRPSEKLRIGRKVRSEVVVRVWPRTDVRGWTR